ncbi:hypothetical protein [Polyangium spumosum]|uniref:DUF4276 family protein n=1 Tax=Polyangium spumosum TaxID=889282 RepID=A0A6N7PL19_9BACT|nr:hypothetical protein [Polyangium spumosum]MRG90795.1 hypothetical protein [Polyangium spumosum]
MKKSQRFRLHVLCEDELHMNFVLRLADRYRIGEKYLFIDAPPKGIDDAKEYVLKEYVNIVDRWRSARHDENVGLLVVIDGDKEGVLRRRSELTRRLKSANRPPVAASDPVAILVPTYSIETWIAWLCGHRPVSELQRYKSDEPLGRDVARKIKDGVYTPKLALAAWTPPDPDEATHVPSLADARDELSRRLDV